MVKGKNLAPYVDPNTILNGRMYLGSFDDSVSRHPWLHTRATAQGLTRHLLLQTLLGPPVCFRIGNLLYHRPYFDAVLNNDVPIVDLARSGFVQIHTKGPTFNETIRLRQKQGTNSTERWVAENDWSPGSDIFKQLTKFDRLLKSGVGKRQYSPNFNQAFGHFSKIVGKEGNLVFQNIYEIWIREGKDGSLTRSDFEKICQRNLKNDLQIREAMSVINSVNHYAYGVGLFGIEKQPLIDTNELISLRRYTTGFGGDDGREVEFDIIDELIRTGTLKVIENGFRVADAMLYPGNHWARYAELLHLDNHADKAIAFRALKVRIVDSISQCVNGKNLNAQKKLLQEYCEEMSAIIRDQIGFPPEKEKNVVVSLAVRAAKYATKKAAFAPITGGTPDAIGLGKLAGIQKTGLDILISMGEDAAHNIIERVQDSVSVADPGGHFRDLLPAVRSTLSWRFMDRNTCEADGLI